MINKKLRKYRKIADEIQGLSDKYKKLTDLPYHLLREIEDFWTHYACLQPDKKIKIGKWLGKKEAFKTITAAQKEFTQASKEK